MSEMWLLKRRPQLTVSCVAPAAILVGLFVLSVTAQSNPTVAAKSASRKDLQRLFDFAYYKIVYKKKYSSPREELVHSKLYLARAFRAFISGVAYKQSQSTFYLSINEHSDWTPNEIVNSLPKVRPFADLESTNGEYFRSMNLRSQDEESIPKELNIIQEAFSDSDDALATISNDLRAIDSERKSKGQTRRLSSKVRKFSFEKLFKNPALLGDKRERESKVFKANDATRSSNKQVSTILPADKLQLLVEETERDEEQYKGPMSSTGVASYRASSKKSPDRKTSSKKHLRKLMRWARENILDLVELGPKIDKSLPDKVFVDHSRERMPQVKSQGQCGSCYAFTIVAFFEWLLCKNTGKLTRLSEQYIVDCGSDTEYKKDVFGCNGGMLKQGAEFFFKYGFELTRNYPYVGAEGTCPYEQIRGKNNTGDFKLKEPIRRSTYIPYRDFAKQLEISPITITIGTAGSFQEYGGGVHQNKNCCKKYSLSSCGSHAVLLVGHGREDGEEYWIMRNSFSIWYGEFGYYRLSKFSDCIWPKFGLVYSMRTYNERANKTNERYEIERNPFRDSRLQRRIEDLTRYDVKDKRGKFARLVKSTNE